VIGRDGSRHEVVAKYRAYLLANPGLMASLAELAGKDLVCWCAPDACHGDVLLELANPRNANRMAVTLAATGHRPGRLGGYSVEVQERLVRLAGDYLEGRDRPKAVVSGMALGWDMAWAFAACELGIPLVAAVPFDGQDGRWPAEARQLHKCLLARAASVLVVSPGPYEPWKFERRNEWMVDNADGIVALWSGAAGGTGRCVAYAERAGKPVENLWARWRLLAPDVV
jgi:hypothetical protein